MFRKRGRVHELASIPELHGCGRRKLEFLATQVDELQFERGQLMKTAGRPCTELLIVISGELMNGEGRLLGAGSVIGAEEMWERRLEPTSVRAMTAGRALTMGHGQFRAWKALASGIRQPSAKSYFDRALDTPRQRRIAADVGMS